MQAGAVRGNKLFSLCHSKTSSVRMFPSALHYVVVWGAKPAPFCHRKSVIICTSEGSERV